MNKHRFTADGTHEKFCPFQLDWVKVTSNPIPPIPEFLKHTPDRPAPHRRKSLLMRIIRWFTK